MVFCTACGKENDDNAKYCLKCGYTISGETKETVTSASVNLDTDEKNSEKGNWIKNIAIFSVIWGVINLLIFPGTLFGGIFILGAILIYIFKSFEGIYYFGVIWFLLGLLLAVAGITYSYILTILGFINFVLGVGIIFYNKKIVVNTSK